MANKLDRLQATLSDRYTVQREIGRGGMATVYLALDVKHDRPVAIKVLKPDLASGVVEERFQREISIAAKLNHPRILPLHDSGSADGLLYYVMPYVEGKSLRERLDEEGHLTTEDAARIAREIGEALDYAHEQGVVHRDIKPDNILLTAGGAVVMDFGIASALEQAGGEQLTQTGMSVGTPRYMAPEQAGHQPLDGRADQYSLACVVYEMLGGAPPFTGPTPAAILARHSVDPVPSLRTVRPGVSVSVEKVVEKALAKVPVDRFTSSVEFADALASGLAGEAVAGVPADTATDAPWWRRRIGYVVPVAGAALVIGWAVIQGQRGESSSSDATAADRTIRRLTSFAGWEWAPNWSPDGSMITYSHQSGGDVDIATLSRGGGDPHILTGDSPADEMNARWSPDGSKIAFVSDRGTGTDVFWIPPTGGAERKVAETHIPFLERMGAWAGVLGSNPWSPDGTQLVFSRLHDSGDVAVWKVDLSSGEETQITFPSEGTGTEDLNAAWSFDGESILFTREDRGVQSLWLIPASGGEPRAILGGEPMWGQAAWFPDNERIVVPSIRTGTFNLWEVTIKTGKMTRLTAGAGYDWSPTVARDGSIAYTQFEHQIDLHWVDVEQPEAEHERLSSYTGQQFGARVSPDGRFVAYYGDRVGTFDLWLLDRSSGQHRPLTDGPANDRLLDWSPDSDEIVFMSDRGGAVHLWIVEIETSRVRQLSEHRLPWASHHAEGQGGPRWAPDGTAIGYLAPEEGNAIWLVEPDGSNPRASTVRGALSFGWYLDGQRVVYTRRAPDGAGAVELRIAHLGTGEDVLLRSGAIAEVDVSPDGSALTFIEAISHFTMELYMLPLSPAESSDELPRVAGEPVQLTFGEGVWHVHSGGWSPDGKGVVYSRDLDRGDVYVIEPDGE